MTVYGTKDASYNNQNVGVYQGADFAFFNDMVVSADVIEAFFKSMTTLTQHAVSAPSTLVLSLFSPVYGLHHFSATNAYSQLSMKFGLPTAGMKLTIDCLQMAGSAMSVMASTAGGVTGVSVQDTYGKAISTVHISTAGRVDLFCYTDGIWTIVDMNAHVSAQAAA